jgi:cytoskeleton protein RodZ
VSDNDDVEFVGPTHEEAPPAPTPAAVELPGQRIGAIIRATRENLGYSMEQVSKETRVHLSHLRAIEDMTPNLLGAPVYAKGYIRSYARHLGLDENATLERYLRECAILKDPEKQTIAPPSTGRKLPVAVPVFGFLIVALAGAAAAFFLMNGA